MSDINDGGPAFPQPCTEGGHAANSPYPIAGGGLSVRDWFAAMTPSDRIQFVYSDFLSRAANEKLVGRKYPALENHSDATPEQKIAYQIDEAKFRMELDAAIRYMSADAMLAARSRT